MIDTRLLNRDPEAVAASLARRGLAADRIEQAAREAAEVHARRRELQSVQALAGRSKDPSPEATAETLRLKRDLKRLKEACSQAEQDLRATVEALPNLPLESTLDGLLKSDNRFVAEHQAGSCQALLETTSDLLHDPPSTTSGVRVAGSGFEGLRGRQARMLRALGNFALALHSDQFEEVSLPALVCEASMFGSGHLPKFADASYSVRRSRLWLAPTVEVAFLAMHRGDKLELPENPLRYMSLGPCFRREIGGGGSTARFRLHQYHQVELFSLCKPSQGCDELEFMLDCAEKALRALELHYRVVELCCGQLPFSAAKAYKLEVYMPKSKAWLDVSTISLSTDFLARRSDIHLSESGRRAYPYTLNASALACSRVRLALLEYSSGRAPAALVPFL